MNKTMDIGIKLSDTEAWPRISGVARKGGSPSEEIYFQPLTCPVGPEATGQSPNQAGKRREKAFFRGRASLRTSPFRCDRPWRGKATGGGLAHAVQLMRMGHGGTVARLPRASTRDAPTLGWMPHVGAALVAALALVASPRCGNI